jgi:hypothetical protein
VTHDELLIEINRRLDVAYYNGDPQSMRALRAVVELHKPLDNLIAEFCSHCTEMSCKDIYTLYPCLTIKAIEKELE